MKNLAQATALVPVGAGPGKAAKLKIAGRPDMQNSPGITVVINDEGRAVDATETAEPLAIAFNGGAHALIADMVSRARASGPICESFSLGGTAT